MRSRAMLMILVIVLISLSSAATGVETLISYQGKLNNATSGDAFTLASMRINITTRNDISDVLWNNTFENVTDSYGVFSVVLGRNKTLNLTAGTNYNLVAEVDLGNAQFSSADIIYGDSSPAGDEIVVSASGPTDATELYLSDNTTTIEAEFANYVKRIGGNFTGNISINEVVNITTEGYLNFTGTGGVNCEDIVGGADTDFCADVGSGGAGIGTDLYFIDTGTILTMNLSSVIILNASDTYLKTLNVSGNANVTGNLNITGNLGVVGEIFGSIDWNRILNIPFNYLNFETNFTEIWNNLNSNISSINTTLENLEDKQTEIINNLNSNITSLNTTLENLESTSLTTALQNNTDTILASLNITGGLNVKGTANIEQLNISGITTSGNNVNIENLSVNQNVSIGDTLIVTNNITATNIRATTNLIVEGDINLTGGNINCELIDGGTDDDFCTETGRSAIKNNTDAILASLNITGGLDVKGTANLENLNISGITVTGDNVNVHNGSVNNNWSISNDLIVGNNITATNIRATTGLIVEGDINLTGGNINCQAINGGTDTDYCADGGDNAIKNNTDTILASLNITGGLDVKGTANLENLNISGITVTGDNINIHNGSVNNNWSISNDLIVGNNITATNIRATTNLFVEGDINISGGNINCNLIDGGTDTDYCADGGDNAIKNNTDTILASLNITGGLDVKGTANLENLNISGITVTGDNINIHNGSVNNNWSISNDLIVGNNLTVGGTDFFVGSDGKVGIGTATPGTTLEVTEDIDNSANPAVDGSANVIIDNSHASGTAILKLRGTASRSGAIVFGDGTGTATDTFDIIARLNQATIASFGADGFVGIGTTTPGSLLDVGAGDIVVNDKIILNGSTGSLNVTEGLTVDSGTLYVDAGKNVVNVSGDFGVSGTAYINNLQLSGITITGGNVNIYNGSVDNNLSVSKFFVVGDNTLFVNSTGNKVGIGTTGPTKELHVVGDMNLTGGDIYGAGYASLDIGEQQPEGIFIRNSIDNSDYGRISCGDSDGDNYCEFNTGLYANGLDTFIEQRLFTRSGIINDQEEDTYLSSSASQIFNLDKENGDETSDSFKFCTDTDSTTCSTELMRITDTGNVGIGTTTPGSLLDVGAGDIVVNDKIILNGTTGSLNVTEGLTIDSGTLYVDSGNDRVGVGTTAPGSYKMNILDTGGGRDILGLNVTAIDTGTGQTVKGIYAEASNEIDTSSLYAGIFNATGTSSLVSVGIVASATGSTNNYAALFTGGGVGIGTTTPSTKLGVVGDLKIDYSEDVADSTIVGANITSNNTGSSGNEVAIGVYAKGKIPSATGNTKAIGLWANAEGGDNKYAAIFEGGKVGIGTTDSSQLLTVNGSLNVSGNMNLTGDFNVSGDIIGSDLKIESVCVGSAGCTVSSSEGRLLVSDSINAGDTTPDDAAYNKFGPGSPTHTGGGEIEDGEDVYITDDLEIDGQGWIGGGASPYWDGADIAENLHTKESRENRFCGGDVACLKNTTNDDLDYGDLVCIDSSLAETITRCSEANSQMAVGFISETFVLNVGKAQGYPIALAGLVPAKVTNENGNINPGDLLVSSSKPGYAMKSNEPKDGTIVGKAVDFCDQEECKIAVFVALS